MIVVDASLVIDFLLQLPPRAAVVTERLERAGQLAAPHLLDAEVAQVLRRYQLRGEIEAGLAQDCLDDLLDLPLTRYPHQVLVQRAFELRQRVTIYDGLYLALAEALQLPLCTCDAALARVAGCQARVEVIGAGL